MLELLVAVVEVVEEAVVVDVEVDVELVLVVDVGVDVVVVLVDLDDELQGRTCRSGDVYPLPGGPEVRILIRNVNIASTALHLVHQVVVTLHILVDLGTLPMGLLTGFVEVGDTPGQAGQRSGS